MIILNVFTRMTARMAFISCTTWFGLLVITISAKPTTIDFRDPKGNLVIAEQPVRYDVDQTNFVDDNGGDEISEKDPQADGTGSAVEQLEATGTLGADISDDLDEKDTNGYVNNGTDVAVETGGYSEEKFGETGSDDTGISDAVEDKTNSENETAGGTEMYGTAVNNSDDETVAVEEENLNESGIALDLGNRNDTPIHVASGSQGEDGKLSAEDKEPSLTVNSFNNDAAVETSNDNEEKKEVAEVEKIIDANEYETGSTEESQNTANVEMEDADESSGEALASAQSNDQQQTSEVGADRERTSNAYHEAIDKLNSLWQELENVEKKTEASKKVQDGANNSEYFETEADFVEKDENEAETGDENGTDDDDVANDGYQPRETESEGEMIGEEIIVDGDELDAEENGDGKEEYDENEYVENDVESPDDDCDVYNSYSEADELLVQGIDVKDYNDGFPPLTHQLFFEDDILVQDDSLSETPRPLSPAASSADKKPVANSDRASDGTSAVAAQSAGSASTTAVEGPIAASTTVTTQSITDFGGIVVQQHFGGNAFFNRSWDEFKHGFGRPRDDFWIGNDELHDLTKSDGFRLRFDLLAKNGIWYYAEYITFIVDDESTGYRMHYGGYSGTAGNGLGGFGVSEGGNLNEMKFTTWDRDNDLWTAGNCANGASGFGGFWYNNCAGIYVNGAESVAHGFGWYKLVPGDTQRDQNLLVSYMSLLPKK